MDLNRVNRSIKKYFNELFGVSAKLKYLCKFAGNEGKELIIDVANIIKKKGEVFVFGMASSLWVSWPIALQFEQLGIKTHWMSAYEGLRFSFNRFSAPLVVLMISQSGETVEILKLSELLKTFHPKPLQVSVTNYPDSTLAQESDITMPIQAGPEIHAPSSSYINTLALLALLYAYVVEDKHVNAESFNDDLYSLAAQIHARQEVWQEWGAGAAKTWSVYKSPIQFLGLHTQMASAWQASMLCSETAGIFSAAGDWATFRHGFEPQVDASFMSIGFQPPGSSQEVWQTTVKGIEERGGQISIVPPLNDESMTASGERGKCFSQESALILPIWETLPIHWFCIHAAWHKGLDASQIERKVTLNI